MNMFSGKRPSNHVYLTLVSVALLLMIRLVGSIPLQQDQKASPQSDEVRYRKSLRLRDVSSNPKAPNSAGPSVENAFVKKTGPSSSETVDSVESRGRHPGLLQTLTSIALALLPSTRRLADRDRNAGSTKDFIRTDGEESFEWTGMLKDARPPVRFAVRNLCVPFLSRLAREPHAYIDNNQFIVESLMSEAHEVLRKHPGVESLLGSPISVAISPFEEKSTISPFIGGSTNTHMELTFTLSGSREAGVAYLSASSEKGIELLTVIGVKSHRSIVLVDRRRAI